MKCPHCLENFFDSPNNFILGQDAESFWLIERRHCPSCKKFILHLANGTAATTVQGQVTGLTYVAGMRLIRPKGSSRPPCPTEVPARLADDYNESCLVIADSPKASAALSRRCLQTLLREAAGVRPSDPSKEIQEVLDSGKLPSDLAASIDAVRNIGNFAAHQLQNHHTGEIVDVEPGEAEWTLEVLESLFDFYYVRPAQLQAKKDALNKKLADAGKPPMK